ncbi:hypothetical protein [Bacillus sp. JCM 19034]|uniref:hypothetical protein n=1 Tax=Bacillus sp. JCM 19034 TaxID=1481928 RepID=UPI0009E72058|nr:hypothetical protein [Bacillus sp. JCM 19034]
MSLFLYGLYGFIIIPFLFGEQYLFQLSIVFSIYMFLVMSSLISDFSSVLLDVRDRAILATKPIEQRTLAAVKVIHVSLYLAQLSFAIISVPLIVAILVRGIGFSLLLIASLALLNLLIVVLTTLLYLFVLRFFNGEFLKDMINYVQIGLSISIVVGYQVIARSFEFVDLHIQFQAAWWQFFLPPIWYASLFEVVLHGTVDFYVLSFSILALIFPIIAMILYRGFLPTLEKYLQKLDSHETNNKERKNKILTWLSSWMTSSKEERVFFHFASIMIKNERQFKLKVYPSIGLSLVLPFLFLFSELRNQSWAELATSQMYLTMYFSLLLIPTIVIMAEFSESYKGAWIYEATPLRGMQAAVKGTLKALIVKLVLPLYLVIMITFLIIFSVRIIPDLLVLFVTIFVYTALCQLTVVHMKHPFSKSFKVIQDSKGWQMLGLIIVNGIFFCSHFVSLQFSYGIYVYFFLLIVAALFTWRRI